MSAGGPKAIIEIVLQKKESFTFCSVNPNNRSSFNTFGGIVFTAVGLTLTTGSEVISLTGSYGKSLSKIIRWTSLSKSKCSGTIFSNNKHLYIPGKYVQNREESTDHTCVV